MVYPIENEVILLIGSDKQWCRVFQIKPLILLHQKKGIILFHRITDAKKVRLS